MKLYPSQNSYYGTAYSKGPNAAALTLDIGGWADWYYSFYQFDLTNSLSSAQTELALLALYTTNVPALTPAPVVQRVTSAWDEATLTDLVNPTVVTDADVSPTVTWIRAIGWKYFDITTLYEQWKDATYDNYGVRVKATANNNTATHMTSVYYTADTNLRPFLVLNPPTLTGISTMTGVETLTL